MVTSFDRSGLGVQAASTKVRISTTLITVNNFLDISSSYEIYGYIGPLGRGNLLKKEISSDIALISPTTSLKQE
jgi:hypothetical protein